MANRQLRIVKWTEGVSVIGVCEHCNAQFKADVIGQLQKAQASINEQFAAHKCKPMDSSQNALRIVRESTEENR